MGEKKKLCAKNGQTKNRDAANFLEKHKNGHVPKKMATMDDGRSPKIAHEKKSALCKKKSFHGRTGHKKGCYEIFTSVGVLNKNARKIDTIKKV